MTTAEKSAPDLAEPAAQPDAAITAEQTKLLFANLPLSVAVTAVIACILAYAITGQVPLTSTLGWLAAMLLVCGARLAIWHAWRRGMPAHLEPGRWQCWFETGAFAAGAVWGSAALIVYPSDSIAHQVFMGFVLASMAAGGVSTLAVHLKSYIVFLLPALMPYTIRLFYEGGDLQTFMGCIFALGLGFLFVSARKFDAVTVNALSLRHENVRLVEALRSALHAAESASRAKSQFLTNMSHELRTPLSGVMGMSELLQKTNLNKQQRRLAGTVNQSAGTLMSLIDDVLDIARVESGQLTLDEQTFPLRVPIEDAIDLCAGAGYRKGLEIQLITEGPLPTSVIGDANRLRQVLINLIGNAVKFTDAGQITLRVAAERTGPDGFRARVSIMDSGIGIAPRDMELLFTPFSQVETGSERRFGGTGLGLAITRHLVSIMGGTVTLESELGKGTTVCLSLPLKCAVTNPAAVEPEPAMLAGKRVLVLDDRALSREAIVSQIGCRQARIDLACSEEETLAKLRRAAYDGDPYDLVLVDRVRPRTDNLAIHRKLRSIPDLAAIRVIAFMPMHATIDATLEYEFGESAFISKPVRRTGLISVIESALRMQSIGRNEPAGHRQPAASRAVPAPSLLKGLRVLLAEDNPVNQEVALAYLEGFGCTAKLAANGLEAIDACEHATFDMVLMDCQMPQVDGLAAVRHIRERERSQQLARLPIVMVTANAFASDHTQALDAGADDFLSKPFSEAQLRRIMEAHATRAAA